MALGQLTEVLCLLLMGSIWKFFRLKWIFLTGICFGILRYAFFSLDSQPWLVAGIVLHGMTYALYFITVQIYLAERIGKEWRTRAQALLTLLTSGVGNLLGYLSTGLWREACVSEGRTVWPLFWWVLCAGTCAVAILFIITYHGVGKRPAAEHSS
jgi:MFS family permease